VALSIALWVGSGLLGYLIWAFVWKDPNYGFPFKTAKDSHLLFLLIFLAAGWFGLAYWIIYFVRRFLNL